MPRAQISIDRKLVCGGGGGGGNWGWGQISFWGDRSAVELGGGGCPTLNVLDATELCTFKW